MILVCFLNKKSQQQKQIKKVTQVVTNVSTVLPTEILSKGQNDPCQKWWVKQPKLRVTTLK